MAREPEASLSASQSEPVRVTFTRQQLETIREFAEGAVDSQMTDAQADYWRALADRAEKALSR